GQRPSAAPGGGYGHGQHTGAAALQTEHGAYLRSSAPPACGHAMRQRPGSASAQHRAAATVTGKMLARRRWQTERGAYLRSSAPPACGHAMRQRPGSAPAPNRRIIWLYGLHRSEQG
ncbi:hypothetical protein O6D91_21400, partial [Cronobacter sakazakii]|uniref:hypothetical protein n=1 Tax=Cronobacter sakazakii TaxID=28141 RepID=UPI0022B3CCB3